MTEIDSGHASRQHYDIVLRWAGLRGRAQEVCEESARLVAQASVLAQTFERNTRNYWQKYPAQARKDLLPRSPYARLLAQLETMPVIEQAKGVLMAQIHCTEAAAFDMLRQASQRTNVPVRDLAAQIIANTVQASPAPQTGQQACSRTRHASTVSTGRLASSPRPPRSRQGPWEWPAGSRFGEADRMRRPQDDLDAAGCDLDNCVARKDGYAQHHPPAG